MVLGKSCGEPQAGILATFRNQRGLVDEATGTIEWQHFCRVLRCLDPAVFTDMALQVLSKQVLDGDRPELSTRLKLEALIDKIFGLNVEEEDPPPEPVLRVRRFTGDVVHTVLAEEVTNLTCLSLRGQCAKLVNRRVPEVALIYQTRKLDDSELIEELLDGEGALDLFLVTSPLPQYDSNQPSIGQLDALKWMLTSPEAEEQMTACREFRRLLSIEHAPPIDRVVELGLVPRMLELCQEHSDPHLQFEAAWALTNVASGTTEQTRAVVDNGGVQTFIGLLSSPSGDVREQAVWALGNVAGDSSALRDVVLAAGALQPVAELYAQTQTLTFKRNAIWTISNFCRGKPAPALDTLLSALPALINAAHSDDDEILTDAAWALSYIADGPNDRIQAVLETGILPRIIELLSHPSPSVQTPSLRTVGNIVTGDEDQTQMVIQHGGLALFRQLLEHPKRGIRKECCWAISNVTAGTREQIQAVLDADLLPPVLHLLEGGEFDIRKEAIWVVCNAANTGDYLQISYMANAGCLQSLVEVLGNRERQCGKLALMAIKNILEAGEQESKASGCSANPFLQPLVEMGLEEAARQQEEVLAGDEEAMAQLEEVLAILNNDSLEES